jgi:hypothetical protein
MDISVAIRLIIPRIDLLYTMKVFLYEPIPAYITLIAQIRFNLKASKYGKGIKNYLEAKSVQN